jgi:hypothetical protein
MKYRIFSKKHNLYTDDPAWPSNQHTSSDYYVAENGEIVELVGFPHNDDGFWYYQYNVVDQDDFVVQMYSGMNDKNNRPVYDGDILKFRWYSGSADKPEWHDDEGEVIFENGIFNIKHGVWFATNDANFDEDSVEIVGNVLMETSSLKTRI